MEHDPLLALADLLRRHRERRGWTQAELAERAGSGFSVDTISKIERGISRPRRHTLHELLAALELSEAERGDVLTGWYASAARRSGRARPSAARGGPPVAQGGARQMADWPMGGYLGARPSGALVGRAEELRRALSALEAAGQGGGRLVLLAGEAGIGKTRLAQEVAVVAGERTFLVAAGRCYESQQSLPFSPIQEALTALAHQMTSTDVDHAARRWPYLARLLPEHLEPPEADGSSSPEEQQRLFGAVVGFIQSAARTRPVALLFDDLQWADTTSLDLLLHLARHTRGERVFLLGAYRDVALPRRHPLRAVLRDLIREQALERVRLHSLTREETAALALAGAGHPLPEPLLDLVHTRTEGNPFFIQQVLQAWRDRATAEGRPLDLDALSKSADDEIPESVRLVIHQRMDGLTEQAHEVLSAGSVLGQSFGFAELRATVAYGEDDLEAALDALIASGLIRDLGQETYTFDHALTQATLYGELSSRRKRRLHRAAGAALERLPPRRREHRAAEIAWHFVQGADPQRAVPWTLRAGDRAATLFAYGDAERQYRSAAELARELGDERAEGEALDKLSEVLYRSGRYGPALESLERAAGIYEHLGERERYLGLVARAGEVYHFAGRVAEGIERVLSVLRAQEEGESLAAPSAPLADLYAALCSLYLGGGHWQQALEAAEAAVLLAEATENRRALCTAQISRGIALGLAGRPAEQHRAFARAAEVAEPLGDPWLLALAVYHRGVTALAADDVTQGEREVRRALDIAERMGFLGWSNFVRAQLSALLVAHGRWAEARREAERAVEESQAVGPRPGGSYPLIAMGRILLLQGERDTGLRCLREALALATRYEFLPGLIGSHEVLAWHEVRDGRPGEAVALLEPLLERQRAAGRAWYPSIYAWVQLELGHEERAAEVLHGARQQALASTSRAGLPAVLLHSATLAARQGRWTEAVRDLWEGVAIARELGLPYDEALLLQEYGRIQAVRGETEQARMRLLEALAIFKRLGAPADAQRVEQMLHALALPGGILSGRTLRQRTTAAPSRRTERRPDTGTNKT